MPGSLRESDISAEKAVAAFLDKHLYPSMVPSTQRIDEKAEQLLGKDIILTLKGGREVIVDEKAMIQYINKGLPTFAFEVGFMSGGAHRIGWLINAAMATEFYLCVWIWAKKETDLREDDIDHVECLLLSKRKILRYLEAQRIGVAELMGFEHDARTFGHQGAHLKDLYDAQGFYFNLTSHLVEKPYNLVMRRWLLDDLAAASYRVTREKVTVLKPLAEISSS